MPSIGDLCTSLPDCHVLSLLSFVLPNTAGDKYPLPACSWLFFMEFLAILPLGEGWHHHLLQSAAGVTSRGLTLATSTLSLPHSTSPSTRPLPTTPLQPLRSAHTRQLPPSPHSLRHFWPAREMDTTVHGHDQAETACLSHRLTPAVHLSTHWSLYHTNLLTGKTQRLSNHDPNYFYIPRSVDMCGAQACQLLR